MRKLHADGYDVVDNLLTAFAVAGYWIEPGDRILDFGCGEGGLVYRLRDLGFDAFGFDIHERVVYRDPADRRFFGFTETRGGAVSDTRVDPQSYRVPFEDDSFDVVVSTSVIEHVMDLRLMMAESARILKPSGFGYHLYPNKSVLIEPHMYVPLASRIQSRWWLRLWAALGIRNEFQEGFSADQTAESNLEFCRTGLRYYTRRELFETCATYFGVVRFVDDAYYSHVPKGAFRAGVWNALKDPYPLRALSRTLRMGSLLTTNKIARRAA